MRRISMALALVSAVAAGCSMSSKTATTGSQGTAKGIPGTNYYVNLFRPPIGGIVTSSIGGIDCGASSMGRPVADSHGVLQYAPAYYTGASACGQTLFTWGQTVTLTATPQGGNAFYGWAGDCKGTQSTCVLTAGADKTVVAIFGVPGAGHPIFTNPAVHGPAFASFAAGDTNALQCNTCHGDDLGGQGIAPACNSCHSTTAFTSGGHGDTTAAAWSAHGWTQACERCHTNDGYKDFVGVDGSANYNTLPYTGLQTNTGASPTVPPVAGQTGYANGPLQCNACHNAVTEPSGAGITTIVFPASVQVTTDKVTALCGQCHMARESTVSMNTLIGATAADAQIVAAGVSFKNPHYRGAAATMFGEVAQGWAQYAGMSYTGQNQHGGAGKCTACHDAHTLEVVAVTATSCGKCHFDETTGLPVTSLAQIEDQRQFGFEGDIDGDGVQAGLKTEILGLNAKLLAAMQSYAFNVVGAGAGPGICFSDATYPYFLKHTGASGDCTAAEITAAAAFKNFTPRLYRAAYNLKFSVSDFGAWAHNPRYAIEVLFDSITDLNAGLTAAGKTPVAFTGKRAFNGHFGAADAATPYAAMVYHGAPQGFTSAACYQCHGGAGGLTAYLTTAPAALTSAVMTDANKVTAFQCNTCHAYNGQDMTGLRADTTTLYFPPQKAGAASAATVVVDASAMPPGFSICASCHSGRENSTSVDLALVGKVNGVFATGIVNMHYLPAAATIFGSQASVAYQFAGKTYTGKPVFWNAATNGAAPGPYGSPHGADCSKCHDAQSTAHSFTIDLDKTVPGGLYHGVKNTKSCNGCHVAPHDLAPVEAEYQAHTAELLAAINTYVTSAGNLAAFQSANGASATGICYDGNTYGYVLVKTAAGCSATAAKFDLTSMKAAYNLHYTQKEPGAWAHNEAYITQIIFDSISSLGATPSFTRP